ncbi:enoyl-CoA hydratase/isomerase family protein [Micromonospora zingiberis]|uniref:Enoyl-CoA hydratase/isomerase family protein n=1 Tax=Micromonospora zingiberis TaxID=2053011 RepID=A0A4V6N390_9ACTN|nr:enoyl-CoA hydratase/isomerase family protein [Micromonospora zingiberis]TCB95465.1 enoyl-CoA hydratase/isomerase family protein [Micromonospora zingiberis]
MNRPDATVRYEVDGALARITLDRPAASNAIDLPTAEALAASVARAADDEAVRAVLLTGAGRRFCAGGDLAAMAAAPDRGTYVHTLASTLDRALRALADLPKPVVVAVQGAAAGAGLAAVLSADVAVATRSATFAAAYTAVGLTPDCGFSRLLPRAVGQPRALYLTLTGRRLTATEALEWGVVAEVVEDDELTTRVEALATDLAAGPVQALGEAKRLLRASWHRSPQEVADDEARTIAGLVTGPEASGRIDAFLSR